MGIRPSLSLIMAITDLKRDKKRPKLITDSRWTLAMDAYYDMIEAHIPLLILPDQIEKDMSDANWQHYLNIISIRDFGKHKCLYDVLEEDYEYGCPEILGVRVAHLPYAHDVLYALAEVEENGYESRFQELPLLAQEKDTSPGALAYSILAQEGGREDFEKQGKWGERQIIAAEKYRQLLERRHNYTQFRTTSFSTWLTIAFYIFCDVLKMKDMEPGMVRMGLLWKWS